MATRFLLGCVPFAFLSFAFGFHVGLVEHVFRPILTFRKAASYVAAHLHNHPDVLRKLEPEFIAEYLLNRLRVQNSDPSPIAFCGHIVQIVYCQIAYWIHNGTRAKS